MILRGKTEEIAIQQGKALLMTLTLLEQEFHLDSDGVQLAGYLERWLEHMAWLLTIAPVYGRGWW